MIIMNIELDNLLLFRDFSLNLSYPKKPVHTTIEEEHLSGRPNFRYKKLVVLMGANATGKTALGKILMGIFIFLWSLLLVIPGIIAAYRYSMAMYLFFDDPEKGALECIRESKAMTYGYKGKLFVLDLSFIGWLILSIIPLVSIYTTPYMSTTKANYYRALRGEFYAQQQQQQNPWGTDGSGYGGGSGWGQQ